jgi:hypothetical protein
MTINSKVLTKFKFLQNGILVQPGLQKQFCSEKTNADSNRLCFITDGNYIDLLLSLSDVLSEPFFLLYVLVVSRRTEHEQARYQSPELTKKKLQSFLAYNRNFFEQDGRHNLWVHSPTESATIVYDRHQIGYAYGPIELFKSVLIKGDLKEVQSLEQHISVPHEHYYHSEFDDEEASVIKTFDWRKSPLREQDEPRKFL